MSKYALEVKNVSKSFRLPTEQASGIKQAFVNWTKGIKGYKEQKVLDNINFKVEKGDFFGIVGRNGSGKSTLLKIISQIYEPEEGEVKVNGSLVPFIELGVGFNPELTGRENVYLNGALLGLSHEEVSRLYPEIVEFAELEEFMDQKLKNYSSGMQVRLAFSIAINADADVLVLDEVLAVGDEAFQRKCFNYFAHLKKEKKTVILVTHSMDSVQRFCNKAMMIEDGEIVEFGNPAKVSNRYRESNRVEASSDSIKNNYTNNENRYIKLNIKHKEKIKDNKLSFSLEVNPKKDIDDAVITFVINSDVGQQVFRWTSDEKIKNKINLTAGSLVKLDLSLQNIFPDGIFSVDIGIKKRDRTIDYALLPEACTFEIIHRSNFVYDIFWKPDEEVKIIHDKI